MDDDGQSVVLSDYGLVPGIGEVPHAVLAPVEEPVPAVDEVADVVLTRMY